MMTTRELNMLVRLNKYTTEYCALEREKEAYYVRNARSVSRVAIVTLYLMQSNVDTLIKQICSLVGRLMREDIDIDNEVAIQVYNCYASSIKRGISNLL